MEYEWTDTDDGLGVTCHIKECNVRLVAKETDERNS